jgi:hypothetical protein
MVAIRHREEVVGVDTPTTEQRACCLLQQCYSWWTFVSGNSDLESDTCGVDVNVMIEALVAIRHWVEVILLTAVSTCGVVQLERACSITVVCSVLRPSQLHLCLASWD